MISFTVSSTTLAWYLASGRTSVALSLRDLRFERRLFGEILRVGAPMSLAPVLNNVALATLTTYAGLLGVTSLAAFGAAVRLEYLLYPLNFGLGAAVLAMVGSNIGARQVTRAARIAWTAVGLSACVMACVSVPGDLRTRRLDGPVQPRSGNPCRRRRLPRGRGLAYPFVAVNTLMRPSRRRVSRSGRWPHDLPLAGRHTRRLDRHQGPSAGSCDRPSSPPRPRDLGVVQAMALRLYAHLRSRHDPDLTGHVNCPSTRRKAASIMPPFMPRAAMSTWRTRPTMPSTCSIPRAGDISFPSRTCSASPAPW